MMPPDYIRSIIARELCMEFFFVRIIEGSVFVFGNGDRYMCCVCRVLNIFIGVHVLIFFSTVSI